MSIKSSSMVKLDSSSQESLPKSKTILERLDNKMPAFGFLLALSACFFYVASNFIIKTTTGIHGIVLLSIRCAFQTVLYAIPILLKKKSFFPGTAMQNFMLMVRGFFSYGWCLASVYSLKMIPFGDATALAMSAPIFTSIFAHFMLGESFTFVQFICLIMCISGVSLIAKPHLLIHLIRGVFRDDSDDLLELNGTLRAAGMNQSLPELTVTLFGDDMATVADGVKLTPIAEDIISSQGGLSESHIIQLQGTGLALTSAIIMAFIYVLVRKLNKVSVMVLLFWFSFGNLLFCLGHILYLYSFMDDPTVRMPIDWSEWGGTITFAIFGVIGQFMLNCALKIEEAGAVSLARSGDILLSFIVQALILHREPIELQSLVGAMIIFTSIFLCAARKWATDSSNPPSWLLKLFCLQKEVPNPDRCNSIQSNELPVQVMISESKDKQLA